MLKITNLGHACFLVEDGSCRLVIDPYDDATGYPPLRVSANMLLMSHSHHDHSFAEGVILEPGPKFEYTEIASFHDEDGGSKRGPNKIFVVEAGGRRICHMGDLGHIPSEEQYAAIGKVDLLLLPVGGFYTIDAAQAAEVARRIDAPMIIPMHYNPGSLNNPISGIDPFLAEMAEKPIVRADLEGRNSVEIEDAIAPRVEVLKMPG